MSSRFRKRVFAALATVAVSACPAFARELRFCAEPNNMPFSNDRGEGFENKIAKLVASDIGATAKFVWAYEWRGFVRKGLNAGLCDVIPGVPASLDRVKPSNPYYMASYAFVQPGNAAPITSFDDARLRNIRIGVQLVGNDSANTPPMNELARRKITGGIRGYMVIGDWSKPDPLLPIIAGVAHRDVDIALVWGPVADYYAALQSPPLRVTHIDNLPTMSFPISMAVRKNDSELANEINRTLERRKDDIARILAEYHIQSSALPKTATTSE
jgi:mxaJ protein